MSELGLVIGAGSEQVAAIVVAQSQGLRVLAIDGAPDAPGLRIADVSRVVDLRDTDAVIAVARENGVSFTIPAPIGRLLRTQACVHEALGLRGVSIFSADACTNKQEFHKLMQKNNVNVPLQRSFANFTELTRVDVSGLFFPLVLKPCSGSGSRGVRVVSSVDQWSSAVKDVSLEPFNDAWIVESFVEGLVLGVDGVVVDQQPEIVMVREKVMSPWPYRVELAYRAPARISNAATLAVQQSLKNALEALQVNNSLFHADLILQVDGTVTVIELSARPSGLRIASEMVPACTGVDFLRQGQVLHRCGGGLFAPQQARPTLLYYWHHDGGMVREVPSEAALNGLPHVKSASVKWKTGNVLRTPTNVSDLLNAGHILITGDSWHEVESTLNQSLSFFEVVPYGSS